MLEGSREIRIISRIDISEVKWDSLVQKSDNSIFMSRWYLDAVMPDWKALVFNDYKACLPVFISRKYGLTYCLQPLFIRECSVLGDKSKFQELLLKLQSETSFFNLAMDVDVNHKNVIIEHSIHQVLTLHQDYESVYKMYSQNVKRSLRDFIKSKAELTDELDSSLLIKMFRDLKGKQFSHIDDEAYFRLSNLIKNAKSMNASILRGVRLNGELVAICCFIRQNGKLLYLKGIVNSKGRDIGAMQAIFDSVIKNHTIEYESLDFGGSNNEGLALFNKKFGAIDRKYLILKYNGVSWPLRSLVNGKIGLK
jgi:hypothetical protein